MVRIEKELWVVAEAVDAIMDVFAEDHLNQVLIEVDMLPTLTSMMPHLKTKVCNTSVSIVYATKSHASHGLIYSLIELCKKQFRYIRY